ncbi:MAG: class I mannose-6-phosphate isomerase [Candidatus Niameybacter stercoravium]|nr:class I mannose-6-phosphate isomerase [Candidatus Niameybacter stercoravium]
MTRYDKYPEVKVKGYDHCAWQGYDQITAVLKDRLQPSAKNVVVVDCYPGVDVKEVVEGLSELKFDKVIYSDECALQGEALTAAIDAYLTEDRVFGVLTTKNFQDVFRAEKIEEAKVQLEEAEGNVLVCGTGAGLITTGDIYIFADLARWEIQMRYRKGMSNWNVENSDAPILTKYKRGFFVEWRMADRHKVANYKNFDYVLDTNVANEPKLVSGEAFFAGLNETAHRPFRVVPYFDAGVWGGQWMKEVCDLDRESENFAWSFDGVPEENSLYLRYGDVRLEVPSINVVFYRPQALLGTKVHARFGTEFPIRFDFLDTMGGQNLSLQVHPLTEYIQQTFGMHYTQDESYYILDCKEGTKVYLGVKEGIKPEEMIEDLKSAQRGEMSFDAEKYINTFDVKKHDHFLIPAGTIHCSGKDTMVLEISATPYIFTFKLWDWDRLGLDGLPRPIHIEHGEKVIDWTRTTTWVERELVNPIEQVAEGEGYIEERTGLHEREFIETRRHWFTETVHHTTQGSVNVLNLVEGEEAVVESPTGEFEPFVVHYAETFIIPESVKAYTIRPHGPSVGKKLATIKAYVR